MLQLIKRHQHHPCAFADDNQSCGLCRSTSADSLCEQVSTGVDAVSSWMMANQLLLNLPKTEVINCSSPQRQHLIPIGHVRFNNTSITSVRSVRDLGIYFDADVTMRTNITATVRSCNSAMSDICGHVMDRLQSVLNTAARLIFSAIRSDYITPLSVNSIS